jgi:CheY-like chemotaxis protein
LRSAPQVLIVDRSAESREVLRTLLERRGAATIEARRPDQAARLADLHRPDLIVFDAESDLSDRGSAGEQLGAVAGRTDTPIVILGTVARDPQRFPSGQFISKPYHYGSLIRKIEELLAAA